MLVQRFTLVYNGSCYTPVYDFPDFTPGEKPPGPNLCRVQPTPNSRRRQAREEARSGC